MKSQLRCIRIQRYNTATAPSPLEPVRMYVCLCNALTDAQLRAAVAAGAARVKDLYVGCGCQAQCGCCTNTVLSILREERPAGSSGS